MKNYTITREQLQKIHDVACPSWKELILGYSRRNPFGSAIEFLQEEVVAMFVASNLGQRAVLEGIFGKQTAEIDLSTGKVDGKVLFDVNRDLNHALMCVSIRFRDFIPAKGFAITANKVTLKIF